jgi:hypothetical protein
MEPDLGSEHHQDNHGNTPQHHGKLVTMENWLRSAVNSPAA